MKLLLDTHVFLWFITGHKMIPSKFSQAIQDSSNSAYLSVASLWEAIIKYQIGKLALPAPPEKYFPRQRRRHRISSLAIDEASVKQMGSLPALHNDPFDRLLVSQALAKDLIVLTVDEAVLAYPVKFLEAK